MIDLTVDVIRELEHLNKLAKEDPNRRFNSLTRLLRQVEFLALAKERITHNKGANTPGVDGRMVKDINIEELTRLSQELTAGTYQPQPVQRRTYPSETANFGHSACPPVGTRLFRPE